MTYTSAQRTVYQLLILTAVTLIAYSAAALISALKFIGPDGLATSLPYMHSALLTSVLGQLALLTGVFAGGLWLVLGLRADASVRDPRALIVLARVWFVWGAACIGAAVLNLSAGRAGLELPPVLVAGQAIITLGFAIIIGRSLPTFTGLGLVLCVGLVVISGGMALALIPSVDYGLDRLLRAAALGIQSTGQTLAAVALGFWCLHRVSNVTVAWVTASIHTTAGLTALAGALMTVVSMQPVIASPLIATISTVSAVAIPLIWLIIAAHAYRALADRNPTATLAGHWVTLALLAWLAAAVIHAAQALPAVRPMIIGTRLTDLGVWLGSMAAIAVLAGTINQVVAELRGENRRITGLMPFWLIAFGTIGGGLALALAGVAQTYMERALGLGYVETQGLLTPLYEGWVVGLIAVVVGFLSYAYGLYARRVRAMTFAGGQR